MSEEEKKAIDVLQDFKNNKLKRDKIEINPRGGFKIGDIYKFTELDPAIEIILKLIEKQAKVIDRMAEDRAKLGEPKVNAEAIKKYYFEKVEEEVIKILKNYLKM